MRLPSHLLAAITVLLVAAPAASAATGTVGNAPPPVPEQPAANGPGMYRVWSCRTPTGQVAPVDGWRSAAQAPAGAVISSCASGGFLGLSVGTGTFAAAGTLEWSPAPGIVGISADLWRTAVASSTQSLTSTPPGTARIIAARVGADEKTASGTPGVPDGTRYLDVKFKDGESLVSSSLPATTRGTTNDLRAPANRITLDPLFTEHQQQLAPIKIDAECAYWYDNYACSSSYTIWAADLRVRDAAAPTVSNVSGSLIDALAAGGATQSGVSGFTARAQDVGSGVLRTLVEVDGVVKVDSPASKVPSNCSPRASADGLRAYLVQVPCPLDGIVTADLDTRTLTDGTHDVRLLVEDAAGNQTKVAAGPLRVNNAPTVGPGSPVELRGEPNGGAVSGDAAQLSAVWPATAKTASTKPSVKRRCAKSSYAQKHPVDCRGRAAANLVERSWSEKSTEPLRLALTDLSGAPVAGARLQVSWTSTAEPADAGVLPDLVTGADGIAQTTVPRAGGSRRFTARWLARSNDTAPATQATATIVVRAATTLTAPRRPKPASMVTFRGTLRGVAGSRADVPVTLEVFNQGEWKTFASTSTGADGAWSKTLRFARRPGKYPVRVQLGKSSRYPFAPAVGAATTVNVRR